MLNKFSLWPKKPAAFPLKYSSLQNSKKKSIFFLNEYTIFYNFFIKFKKNEYYIRYNLWTV